MLTYIGSYVHLQEEWIIIRHNMSLLTPLKDGEFERYEKKERKSRTEGFDIRKHVNCSW